MSRELADHVTLREAGTDDLAFLAAVLQAAALRLSVEPDDVALHLYRR